MAKKNIKKVKLTCETCGKVFIAQQGKRAESEHVECQECWDKRQMTSDKAPVCTLANVFIDGEIGFITRERDIRLEWEGNTYPVKDLIKSFGFRWNRHAGKWILRDIMSLLEAAELMRKIEDTDSVDISSYDKEILVLIERRAASAAAAAGK